MNVTIGEHIATVPAILCEETFGPRPKRVVIYGPPCVGKSSIIKALAGRALASTKVDDVLLMDGVGYHIISTNELGERAIGRISDIDLIIYTTTANLTLGSSVHYKAFADMITKYAMPTMIIVTGCESFNDPGAWAQLPQNVKHIHDAGIPSFVPILSTCFAESNDPELEESYDEKRRMSAFRVWNAIELCASSDYFGDTFPCMDTQ